MIDKEKYQITEDDLQFILQADFAEIADMAKYNTYCRSCNTPVAEEMINYRISLNDLNDVIFEGECKACRNRIVRYIGIGETRKYLIRTMAIKAKV